ncbi:Dps family protein [Hyphococcus sp.]|uniref:Dps family protein n=1 Tax=Hyphococcus sp. TaxID=2038636 RepID=UPI00207EB548|nr:MAG: DNA starvation/stationary phase protection protein [Marinicaulis sp.]
MTKIDIGIDENARNSVAQALNATLADTYSLYMKTHAYHWNVTGPQFQTLHLMFEGQYNEMWTALDEIAERVRALGVFAPTSGKQFAELSAIDNADTQPPKSDVMVSNLLADHETLIKRARNGLAIAEEAGDAASADLLTVRIQLHEKTAWMLRSLTQ